MYPFPKAHVHRPRPLALPSSPRSFLKACLPGYGPQVGLNKVLYFFLWLAINFSLTSIKTLVPNSVTLTGVGA